MKKYSVALALVIVSSSINILAYAGTIEDVQQQLSGRDFVRGKVSPFNKSEAINILKELSFNPPPGDPSFWNQSPPEFKKSNHKGVWKKKNWNETELELQADSPHAFILWQMSPVDITVRFSDNKLNWVMMNLWNKGDSDVVGYNAAAKIYHNITERLKKAGVERNVDIEKISSVVKKKWESYRIEQTDLSLSFERDEYLIVRLMPFDNISKSSKETGKQGSRAEFREQLKNNLKHQANGDVYISGIPMIEQGKKGYCAPATCARVMRYYGIDVDMHLLADVMKTMKRGGTFHQQMQHSLRWLCRGNPVSYKRLASFKPWMVKRYIDKGMPIIWGIPGHIRLIVGYNEDREEIIYSDSWGLWATARRMSYNHARNITVAMYVLR